MTMLRSTAVPVPELHTTRLRLRGPGLADVAPSGAMWRDPEVVRFIGGRPSTGEEVWSRVLRYVGHWALLGFGYWAIEERASGRFVGELGFADFHRELEPGFGDTPEVGWALAPWAHGQGFAGEALRAALAWGDAHLASDRTVCIIDGGNARSIKLAHSVGFAADRTATYKGEPITVYQRLRPPSSAGG